MNAPSSIDSLFADIDMAQAPGLMVGVALNDQILYRKGFGLASVELGIPNSPDTPVRIGSVTKQLTCFAALLMAEDGLLDLDASVSHYLPALAAPKGEATLRQLMHHTAGFRCYLDIGLLSDGLAVKPPGAAMAAQLRQRGANFAPGEQMVYSNGGYQLLSRAMERAAGMPLEEIFRLRLFQSLGMMNTTLMPSDVNAPEGTATLYTGSKKAGFTKGIFPSQDLIGEGGVVSTVDDMLRWTAQLRHRTLGSAKTWHDFTSTWRFADGTDSQYALGLFVETYRGMRVLNHAGNVVGGASHLMCVPDQGLDIVIMTNGAAVDPIALAERITDSVLGLAAGDALPMAGAAAYRNLLGIYHSEASGFVCSLVDDDGLIALSVFGDRPQTMVPCDAGLELSFSRNSAGHYVIPLPQPAPDSLALHVCGRTEVFRRIAGEAPVPADIAGRYVCDDLAAEAIVETGSTANMTITGEFGGNTLALSGLGTDLMTVKSTACGFPRGGIVAVRRDSHGVAGLVLNLARSRNLLFKRVGAR